MSKASETVQNGSTAGHRGRVIDGIAIVTAIAVIGTLGMFVHWAAALAASAVFAIDARIPSVDGKPAVKVYGFVLDVALPITVLIVALALLDSAPHSPIVPFIGIGFATALVLGAVYGIVQKPDGKVFSTIFDVAVPATLLAAIAAFLGIAFDSPLAALTAIGVFVLGLVPQAKMKRADMVSEMQKRFGELAGDKDAIIGDWTVTAASGSGVAAQPATRRFAPGRQAVERMKKAAGAFYLRFWNLQLLEFGLWRYGMIPSDTYAHWIVRRLISFTPDALNTSKRGTEERYWRRSPRRGWIQARPEFRGTDFKYFIDAADGIRLRMARAGAASDYDLLHLRIERLLVAVSGGGLWSTFILRWFNARRPSLKGRMEELVASSEKPLLRERRSAQGLFLLLAAASILPAAWMGHELRTYTKRLADRPRTSLVIGGNTAGGAVVLDPDQGPAPVFVVRFDAEGSCHGGSDPRTWRGAQLSRSSAAFVDQVARGLVACHDAARPVRVEIVGFASSSQFSNPSACGSTITDADEANLALARGRAQNVAAVVGNRLPQDAITIRQWNGAVDMQDDRAIVDRITGDKYSEARGSLNRRVEIRVVSAGGCGRE